MYVAYIRLTDGMVWPLAAFSKYPDKHQIECMNKWLREGDSLHISPVPVDVVPTLGE